MYLTTTLRAAAAGGPKITMCPLKSTSRWAHRLLRPPQPLGVALPPGDCWVSEGWNAPECACQPRVYGWN